MGQEKGKASTSRYVHERLQCLQLRYPELLDVLFSHQFPADVVEEAAQNAVIQAIRKLKDGTILELKDRWAWLVRVAVNCALAQCRRQAYLRARFSPLEDDIGVPSPVERWIEVETIRSAVERLPIQYRKVVIYRYLEDHSHAETMEQFNLTDGALRRRLQSARRLLGFHLKNLDNSARSDDPGASE